MEESIKGPEGERSFIITPQSNPYEVMLNTIRKYGNAFIGPPG